MAFKMYLKGAGGGGGGGGGGCGGVVRAARLWCRKSP